MSNTKSPGSAGKSGHQAAIGKDSIDQDAEEADFVDEEFADPESADQNAARDEELSDTDRARASGGLWIMASVAAVIIVLDQITKVWAASSLADRDIDLFWTARFHLIRNFGSAFGLGSGLGRWLGLLITGIVIAVVVYARKITDRRMLLLLGGIVGGAVGNLIDRVARAENGFMSGGVIDFIDFQWWPVFNIADMAVVMSALGLMLLSMREPE